MTHQAAAPGTLHGGTPRKAYIHQGEAQPMDRGHQMVKILVADDERLFRDLYEEVLGDHLFKAVPDGRQAVSEYRAHVSEIDFVLLDMNMPGLDGADAAREILDFDPNARLAFATGYARQEVCKLFDTGKYRIFTKPLHLYDLLEYIIHQVEGKPDART